MHAQATVPPHPSRSHPGKTTHATQTQEMVEQEHQDDDSRGEPATLSTPTPTTTREGRQRPANPDDLCSPRSREHAPGALPPSPTHTVCSAHQEPTTQCSTGHYPGTTNTTGPQGGGKTGEGTTRRQLEPEPDQTPSQRTHYRASATDRTASNTTRQRTPCLDRTEYSQNTDYSHMPRRDTNDLNSPSNRGRGRAPDTYTPSPTHTVYSAQREETRHTQGHADRCPETAGTTGPQGQSETGGQMAQRRLDPEQDPNPSQHTDYSDRTTN